MKQKYNKKQKAGFLVGLMILVALLIVSCISVSGFMREQASLKTVQKDTALSVQMYPGSPTISEFTWEDVSSEFCITCYVNTIEGTAKLCNNANAPGISVLVQSASGSKSTTTGSTGYWQVDVGALTGGNWTWGIPFTVTYSGSCSGISWTGSDSGIVSSPPTCLFDCGTTFLSPLNPLTASASGSPTTILAGGSVSFIGSATGGYQPYVSWSWNFGGDGTSPLQNPTHTFNTPGTYNCILTVTDTCGNTDPSNPVVITVNPALSCDAGGPYSGTKCACVQLSGTPTGGIPPYSHSWDFDSSNGIQVDSTLEDPCAQYNIDGVYTVTYKVTDSQSHTATDTAQVTISTSPVIAEAGGPYTGSVCNPISFSGSATGGCTPYTYSWVFGDGGSGSGQNPTHQYTTDGSFTATVTVTDGKGTTDTDTASVIISTTALVADSNGPYSACTSISINFMGSASGGCTPYSYSWSFGDGGGSNQQNPTHAYANAGTYTVTLTVTDNKGQTDVDTTTATIITCDINVDAGGPYYGDVDASIQFYGSAEDGTPPYYYQWSFGDGSTSEIKNPTHTYSMPSPAEGYKVVLYVTDSKGTSGQDQTRAYVTGDLIANAGGSYYGELGLPIQFTGSASGGTIPYSYSWDFDKSDGIQTDSTLQNPTYTYDILGTYTVTLTVTDDNEKTAYDETTAAIGQDIPEPDLECEGTLSWSNVVQGTTVNGTFTVINNGDPGSKLDWEIDSYPPDWGTWTFTPVEGSDLTPESGEITVQVTLVAPKTKIIPLAYKLDTTKEFTGNVTIINQENPIDKEVIPISITVSKNKAFTFLNIYEYLLYRFPFLGKILLYLS